MNGGNDQFLTGTGTTTLNNFTINKTSGDFIMNTPLTVTNNLSLISGIIQNSNDVLTIGTSSANEGSISYISEELRENSEGILENGNVDVLFPVGDAVNTKQVMINFQGSPGTNQYLTVAYETGYAQGNEGNLVNGLPLSTPDGAFIDNVSSDGYWEIMPTDDDYTSTINSKTYTISLQAVNLTGGMTIAQRELLRVLAQILQVKITICGRQQNISVHPGQILILLLRHNLLASVFSR